MKLKPEDLRIDIFSKGMPNDECAYRVTHLPTGIVASCDTDCPVHCEAKDTYGATRKACAISSVELLVYFDKLKISTSLF